MIAIYNDITYPFPAARTRTTVSWLAALVIPPVFPESHTAATCGFPNLKSWVKHVGKLAATATRTKEDCPRLVQELDDIVSDLTSRRITCNVCTMVVRWKAKAMRESVGSLVDGTGVHDMTDEMDQDPSGDES